MAAAKSRSRRATSRLRPKSTARRKARKPALPRARTRSAARPVAERAPKRRAARKSAATKPAATKRTATKRAKTPRATTKRAVSRPAKSSAAPRATAPSVPNGIGLVAQHLDFTSHDLDGVRRFYTELLGFTKFQHDAAFDYLHVSLAPQISIGFMPPMPGPPEQWRPPREPALYLVVEDVDRTCSALLESGVVIDQPPTDMSWGDRVARLRDPEGRMVCIAQHLQKG